MPEEINSFNDGIIIPVENIEFLSKLDDILSSVKAPVIRILKTYTIGVELHYIKESEQKNVLEPLMKIKKLANKFNVSDEKLQLYLDVKLKFK